jgi:hypothetical protein
VVCESPKNEITEQHVMTAVATIIFSIKRCLKYIQGVRNAYPAGGDYVNGKRTMRDGGGDNDYIFD